MPSSVIRYFDYNKESHTLKIIFVTGIEYHYKNVPERVFQMLRAAGSKGRYFNHYIKDKFKFKKVGV
ncbi:KTSC domain-containing protein [Pedobacter africanus]|uniref:KTSC domain-containing protein n=1 Tax=Pedobacter africanus TaxID=151894 RepID=A0A1W2DBH9_9SPHI|nr:KTSC domain-containing protein [Pedobacter africanus]SMC94897.1 KTSC domain-containing protein [Pedobacter africanus]